MNQTKSKPAAKPATAKRGGARKGAGRKPGTANRKTREIADKAAAAGTTPLEVMLQTMQAFVSEAEAAGKEKDDATRLKMLVAAAGIAKDAAPYIHPRLQAIEHTGKDGGPMEFEQRIADIEGLLPP